MMMQYSSLANEKPLDVLRLIRTQNVGPVTFFNLVAFYGSASAALEKLPELARRGGRKQPLIAYDKNAAQKEIDATEKFGARMILYGAPDYPKLLLALPDAPPLITVIGHAHLWRQKPVIALVGARNASANGCQFAQKLARDLGEAGFTVVSGLARGIDTFAHKGSLAGGTVGVIAGGIDNIYPPENAILFGQLKETGAIVSEQPFGAIPFAGAFPGRNRIIAGMSMGTVIVEAAPKSGSLITARLAGEYNREVFAVPGSPLDPRSKGCNQLLKDGAHMAESAADIIQGIAHLRSSAMEENPPATYTPQPPPGAIDDAQLDGARALVLEKLGYAAVSVDELIAQCNCPAGIVLTILLELELAGRVRRSAGNKVALASDSGEEVA
jgi:DNA processing protein